MTPSKEATITTARMGLLGAVSVIVTHIIEQLFPGTPEDVVAAAIVLVLIAVDRYEYKSGGKIKVPF